MIPPDPWDRRTAHQKNADYAGLVAALTAEIRRLQEVCAEGARAFTRILPFLPEDTVKRYGSVLDRDRLWLAARGHVPDDDATDDDDWLGESPPWVP